MKMSDKTFEKIESNIVKCCIQKWNNNSSSRYVNPKNIRNFADGDLGRTQEIGLVMKEIEFLEKHNKNQYWISNEIVNHKDVRITNGSL